MYMKGDCRLPAKMWNMRTYTEMVARTTTMEAHLQGTANRRLSHAGLGNIQLFGDLGNPYSRPFLGEFEDYLQIILNCRGEPALQSHYLRR
jgi:hypothetical protein